VTCKAGAVVPSGKSGSVTLARTGAIRWAAAAAAAVATTLAAAYLHACMLCPAAAD
jgi:hypothetical protein